MKTVFEGTVNGKKFDNVFDYNNALSHAIQAGLQINASSRTKTVLDDQPECECECACNGECECTCNGECECTCNQPEWFFGLEEGRELYYLDTLSPENLDNELQTWYDGLENNRKSIFESMSNFNQDDFDCYKQDLMDVIENLNKDSNNINLVLNSINSSLAEKTNKLDNLAEQIQALKTEYDETANQKHELLEKQRLVNGCNTLNNMMLTHYGEIIGEVERIQCTPNNDQPEEQIKNENNSDILSRIVGELDKVNIKIDEKTRNLLNKLFPSM